MEIKERVEEVREKEPIINDSMSINLISFAGVQEFKSIRRAMRRGHIAPNGIVPPKRPFNNRKRNKGTRPLELKKESIYEQLKSRRAA